MGQSPIKSGSVIENYQSLIFPNQDPASPAPQAPQEEEVTAKISLKDLESTFAEATADRSSFVPPNPQTHRLTETPPRPIQGVFRPKKD